MGYYITINISTEGLAQVGAVNWGTLAIVGRATGSNFTLDTPYVIRSALDAKELFGEDSALYQSILIAFNNGATKVIAVATDVDAVTPDTFSGDGNETEFTLTDYPAQPMGTVTVNANPLTEGEDFEVDYGNKKIEFFEAPASGTDNISVAYDEYTAAHLATSLAALEIEDVQIISGAMMFDTILLEDILDHCVAMKGINSRIGVYMQPKGDASITLVTTLENALSILVAHNSLKDVASAVAGRIAGVEPWKDMTFKDISGLQQTEKFTPTQFADIDAAHIINMYDPPKDNASAKRISTGWTLDPSGTQVFIDTVRTAHFLAGTLEVGLHNQNIIGEIPINRAGMRELDTYIGSLINPYKGLAFDRYEIYNRARQVLFEPNPADLTPEEKAEIVALQAGRRLEGANKIIVTVYRSGTVIYIELDVAITGGV